VNCALISTVYKNTKTLLFALVLTATSLPGFAQLLPTAHAGVGMLEHLSLGVGCNIRTRHTIAFLYGSNLFIDPKKFSNYLVQYHYNFPKWSKRSATPLIGFKGGQAIYSDDYYTWQVIVAVPFVGFQFPLIDRLDFLAQGGVAFSFEQSATRLSYGEIGHYRSILPEARVGIVWRLKRSEQ
jgi:hypothetical protein